MTLATPIRHISPLVIGIISGTAGALLALFLYAPQESAADPIADGAETASLRQRIADLEDLSQGQAAAIHALGLQLDAATLQREDEGFPTREEFAQLVARLDGMLTDSESFSESAGNDRLQDEITTVLNQREEESRRRKEKVVEDKRAAYLQNQVDHWVDHFALNDVQATQFEELLHAREDARRAIGAAVNNGEMSKADAAVPWQQAIDDYNNGLRGVLTEQQMEEIVASRRNAK